MNAVVAAFSISVLVSVTSPISASSWSTDAAALDIPDHRLYDRVIDALKINRTKHTVNPFEPLPRPQQPYDYVTAYQIAFNQPGKDTLWGSSEWAFFIEDVLNNQLTSGGRLHLELNWSFRIGAWYDADTKRLFDRYDARRAGNEIDIYKT